MNKINFCIYLHVKNFYLLKIANLPAFGTLLGELGEVDVLARVFLAMLFAACLHKECVGGHAALGFTVLAFLRIHLAEITKKHKNNCLGLVEAEKTCQKYMI